jgi:hypothetical protein
MSKVGDEWHRYRRWLWSMMSLKRKGDLSKRYFVLYKLEMSQPIIIDSTPTGNLDRIVFVYSESLAQNTPNVLHFFGARVGN